MTASGGLRRQGDEPIRVAVIGVGAMGVNHARVYRGLKGAELVAVVDTDPDRAGSAAARFDCAAITDPAALPGLVDAVSVAVPSALHAAVAVPLMDAGIHTLVEKPLAASEADATAMIEAASRNGVALLVGHIERFNPAVRQLKEIVAGDHEILAVDARRMSAVSGRVTDIDVVTDLMVHDLDIVLDLIGERVIDVTARAVMRGATPGEGYVTALLGFEGGTLATLTASRITQNQVRELQVTTDHRFFSVDYSNQELRIYRQGRIGGAGGDPTDSSRYVLDVGTERVFVRRVEPLAAELEHFLDVVRRRAAPLVTGAQALEALRLVWRIHEQIDREAR